MTFILKTFCNEFPIDCKLMACSRGIRYGAINFNLSFHDYWILDEFLFILEQLFENNDPNDLKMLALCSIKQFHSDPTSLKSLYPFRSLWMDFEWTFISRCTFLCTQQHKLNTSIQKLFFHLI